MHMLTGVNTAKMSPTFIEFYIQPMQHIQLTTKDNERKDKLCNTVRLVVGRSLHKLSSKIYMNVAYRSSNKNIFMWLHSYSLRIKQ